MPVKKPENKKCPNCGACQECGHGGTQQIPYPVYPRPPYYAWWSVTPYTQPNTSGGIYTINATSGSSAQYIQ